MRNFKRLIVQGVLISVSLVSLLGAKKHDKNHANKVTEQTSPKKKGGSLAKSSFQEILDRYIFIADFNEKPAEREISDEVFWRYPFKLAPQTFDFSLIKEELDGMVFRVPGEGRLAEHYAKGRVEFLEGRYDDAHATWLTARQQFDKDPLTNRRLEFLLAVNAGQVLLNRLKTVKYFDRSDAENKKLANRFAYFLASVFILKKDIPDPQIDKNAPWGLYNLSVIYHMLERWSLVAGSTQEGLGALLKQGRKEFRSQFRQMMAEIYIKIQDLLPAIQELDTAIRQDPNPAEAARMFNRAGDIYFDLNNYELAEEIYGLASRIDETRVLFNPSQGLLRGESLFWLGQFERSRQMIKASLEASIQREGDWLTESKALPWMRLRIGDTWLAQISKATGGAKKKAVENARLEYFRVESEHPGSEAAKIAQVRGACMELPNYEGNNIKHARDLLENTKDKKDVPEVLMELVEACLVSSYSERERTVEMVQKVKGFSDKYPNSKFFERMIPAVRDVQATNIDIYFEKDLPFSATDFFEKRRSTLYPKVSPKLAENLFQAYVDTTRSEKAEEFWEMIPKRGNSRESILRNNVFLTDIMELGAKKKQPKAKYMQSYKESLTSLEGLEWKDSPSKKEEQYISRLFNGPKSTDHLLWIAKASEKWSEKEKNKSCDVFYPLASRLMSQRKDANAMKWVKAKIEEVLPASWEDLIDKNPTCAQSWLDLETKSFKLSDLRNRYKERDKWKLEGPWLERLWAFSEDLDRTGDNSVARTIWTRISNEAPKDSFESRMAKTKLDPTRTEVESLWK